MFREHALWGRAEGAGVVKRRTLRGNIITLYNYLERGVERWGLVSSTVPAVRGPEKMALSWGKRFRWDIRKNIFTVSLVRHWNRLPREGGHQPWKYWKGVLISHWVMIQWFRGYRGSAGLMVGRDDGKILLQPQWFYDFMSAWFYLFIFRFPLDLSPHF